VTAGRPPVDHWVCRPAGWLLPCWHVVVEFHPPSADTLLRANSHPRADRLLERHIVRIDANPLTRWLIRTTRRTALRSGIGRAISEALPADEPTAPRVRRPHAEALRAETLYIALLCETYGWTPDEARALTPREMRAFAAAAHHHADLRFGREAALRGINLPNPPPLRLDARDTAAAAAVDAAARKTTGRRGALKPDQLSDVMSAVAHGRVH